MSDSGPHNERRPQGSEVCQLHHWELPVPPPNLTLAGTLPLARTPVPKFQRDKRTNETIPAPSPTCTQPHLGNLLTIRNCPSSFSRRDRSAGPASPAALCPAEDAETCGATGRGRGQTLSPGFSLRRAARLHPLCPYPSCADVLPPLSPNSSTLGSPATAAGPQRNPSGPPQAPGPPPVGEAAHKAGSGFLGGHRPEQHPSASAPAEDGAGHCG